MSRANKLKILHPTLWKSQLASMVATLVDFSTLAAWVEIFHFYYVAGVPVGACLGALTNFLINRHWSYDVAHRPVHTQAVRYTVVSIGSLALNTVFVYVVTEHLHFQYLISKAVVSFLVGILYNYPLHRFYVYRKEA